MGPILLSPTKQRRQKTPQKSYLRAWCSYLSPHSAKFQANKSRLAFITCQQSADNSFESAHVRELAKVFFSLTCNAAAGCIPNATQSMSPDKALPHNANLFSAGLDLAVGAEFPTTKLNETQRNLQLNQAQAIVPALPQAKPHAQRRALGAPNGLKTGFRTIPPLAL